MPVKRLMDIVVSFLGIIILLPLFIIIGLLIAFESRGGVFYRQLRVGKNGKDFKIWKFRSMRTSSDKKGLLTVGEKDNRITRMGLFIRKYKLDEFPQLFNVLAGQMSLVGPRPEVRKYVDLYSEEQLRVLHVKPGITDLASIAYMDENRLLGLSDNPEKTYIDEVMPAKLKLNMEYISKMGFLTDLKIIFNTLTGIFVRP
ncbi:MAG: sugar transferase [Bacteroidales bacterium]|nr:sugar transferase [Bacteroidales bacterium]